VAVNAGKVLPILPAPKPIDVLLLLHVIVVPDTLLIKFKVFVATDVLLQKAMLPGIVTTGVGLTNTVAKIGAPG